MDFLILTSILLLMDFYERTIHKQMFDDCICLSHVSW